MLTEDNIKDYLERSGDSKLPFGHLIEEPDKGFMIVQILEDCVAVMACYGDGSYWLDIATQLAKLSNVNKVRIATRRNPKTFERKFGFEITGYVMEKVVN